MYLENLVFNALDAQRLGRFWEAALGCEQLTDEPGAYETRLSIPDGPALDLCFQQVPEPPTEPQRLHLDLYGDTRRDEVVDRLLGLGATHLDVGQGDVPWVVLADPEGNPFCVMGERDVYRDTGPITGLPLDSADPVRDVEFWAWLTGWKPQSDDATTLRHPSGRGPLLQICDEPAPKADAQNRLHLDLRLEAGERPDDVAAQIARRGGRELPRDRDDLPWRIYADPSGNEFCVLPHRH